MGQGCCHSVHALNKVSGLSASSEARCLDTPVRGRNESRRKEMRKREERWEDGRGKEDRRNDR